MSEEHDWATPKRKSVMLNSLYSHNLQKISSTKLTTQLHKQHNQQLLPRDELPLKGDLSSMQPNFRQ